MIRYSLPRVPLVLAGLFALLPVVGEAQTIGTFRWQLQPYCNVVTLHVVQQGEVFTLDGFDDQCGAGPNASVTGTAFPNADGTIGFGLSAVTAPAAVPVHVAAQVVLATLNGTWRDSVGNAGTLTFTPGAGRGGAPRVVPDNGIAAGSIIGLQIAHGVIGPTHLAAAAIGAVHVDANQLQLRVTGTCAVGTYLRGVNANGTVVCEPLPAADRTGRQPQ